MSSMDHLREGVITETEAQAIKWRGRLVEGLIQLSKENKELQEQLAKVRTEKDELSREFHRAQGQFKIIGIILSTVFSLSLAYLINKKPAHTQEKAPTIIVKPNIIIQKKDLPQ